MPEIGDRLSREELSQHYGRAFNRLVLIDAGQVLAVAARKTYNPEAPHIILAGPGDAREDEIAVLEAYQGSFELWVSDDLRNPHETQYEFMGNFGIDGATGDPAEIQAHPRVGVDLPVIRVLYLSER